VEAKKETIAANDHVDEEEQRRPEAQQSGSSAAAEVEAAAPAASPATPSAHGHHAHSPAVAQDHELDADLGDLPTLWYGETHQIQPDDTLSPNQGKII
jgi:hypothetical protein